MYRSVLRYIHRKLSERSVFNLILCILCIPAFILLSSSIISDYLLSNKYKSPVRWRGIDIQFPEGTAYFFEGQKAIVFWRPYTYDHIYIYPHEKTKEEILEFMKRRKRSYRSMNYKIINSKIDGKGKIFELETVDDDEEYYEKLKCYPDFCIDYSGSRKDKYEFLSILEDFEKKISNTDSTDNTGRWRENHPS